MLGDRLAELLALASRSARAASSAARARCRAPASAMPMRPPSSAVMRDLEAVAVLAEERVVADARRRRARAAPSTSRAGPSCPRACRPIRPGVPPRDEERARCRLRPLGSRLAHTTITPGAIAAGDPLLGAVEAPAARGARRASCASPPDRCRPAARESANAPASDSPADEPRHVARASAPSVPNSR